MAYRKGDFPFEIIDIVDLVGLVVKKKYTTCWYAQCPFCDDMKSHLRIDLNNDYYNCPRCGTGGGMLNLYSRLTNTHQSEAYEDICERKKILPSIERVQRKPTSPLPTVKQRTMEEVRSVYQALIDMMPLNNHHLQSLLKRGFTLQDIKKIQFRSIKKKSGRCNYSDKLIEAGFDLEGVPGFYFHPNLKRWVMYSPYDGIIYPQIGSDGLIGFLSIRKDNEGKNKYVWFSSTAKLRFKGCELSSVQDYPGLLHYTGDFNGGTLLITEGQIKSEVIYSVFKKLYPYHNLSVIGQSGVGAQTLLPNALENLSSSGFNLIVEAYDRDKFSIDVAEAFKWENFKENDASMRAAGNLVNIVMEATKSWIDAPRFMHLPPSRYPAKGYDDSLLLAYNKVRKGGELSVRGIAPSYWPYALNRR